MAIRKVMRAGTPVLFIDIRYRTPAGRKRRYRRDAQVQTLAAARSEERRLLAHLAEHGELPVVHEQTGTATTPGTMTFGQIIDMYKKTTLQTKKPSTRAGYVEILDGDFLAGFLDTPLGEVNAAALAKLDAQLVKKKVSASRRRNVHVVVRSVLRAGVAQGSLSAMPALPKLPRVGRTVVEAFPADALPKLLAAASPQARLAFALAAYAGLRAGEVRGLRWGDVNLGTRTIVVRRSITRKQEAPPKSGHERLVPIAEPLLALLSDAGPGKASVAVARTLHGKTWGEHGLLQAFHRACRRAGLPQLRFHSLRHTFVTELLRRGAAAHAVKALAGHSSLAVTERYAHVAERDLRAAITTLT
ncbi:MAG: site-specific integrase [Polyangiaceae bacterium]|nr:site-specific integrase [Polyangiaceae bacterium]